MRRCSLLCTRHNRPPCQSSWSHPAQPHSQPFIDIRSDIRADIQLTKLYLGVPIDHRLEPLLDTGPITPGPLISSHARTVGRYGRHLQRYQKDISDNETKFARCLAMPETKDGVVISHQQPAERQRYFPNHHQTVKECGKIPDCCTRDSKQPLRPLCW